MDIELLRKQLTEEIQAQFETRLREAKRQKSHAEEEFENASERWRTERRRLNSEIDRLEVELADAKSPARQKPSTEARPAGIPPEELAKIQQAAEEKLNQATAEWQSERERLLAEHTRLERAVADAIERSSNPIRSTQAIQEQFEIKLDDVVKQRTNIEQDFLRAKAAWDEDKKKLIGELIKLRRLAPSKAYEVKEKIERIHGRMESLEEMRIHELENQLAEARGEASKYHETGARAQYELAAATKEIKRLRQRPAEPGQQNTDSEDLDQLRQEYEAKIHETDQQQQLQTAKISNLEVQLAEAHREVQAYQEAAVKARQELAAAGQEVVRLQHTLEESRDKVSSEALDQLRREYESNIQLIVEQKADEDLQIRKLEAQLAEALLDIQKHQDAALEAQRGLATATQEIHVLQQALSESRDKVSPEALTQLREEYEVKIQQLFKQKTDEENQAHKLEAQLAEARAEGQKHQEAAANAQTELATAIKEVRLLQRTLAEMRKQHVGAEALDQLRNEYEARIQQMVQQRAEEETQLHKLEAQLAEAFSEVQKHQDTALKTEQELATATQEVQVLQRTLSDTRGELDAEAAEQLRQEYEREIRHMVQQRTDEQSQLQRLETQLTEALTQVQKYEQSAAGAEQELATANKEVQLLQQTLSETREQMSAAEQRRQEHEAKIQEMVQQKTDEESQLHKLEAQLGEAQAEVQKYQQSAVKAEQELEGAAKEVQLLQRTLSETREQVSAEIVEQLRRQYESKIQETIQEKTQLAQDLESATSMLESERSRFASEFSKSKSNSANGAGELESEVKRIEQLIQVIAALIDNPETELSTVIRKNVEKAELGAYLRGILFSLGRAKAL